MAQAASEWVSVLEYERQLKARFEPYNRWLEADIREELDHQRRQLQETGQRADKTEQLLRKLLREWAGRPGFSVGAVPRSVPLAGTGAEVPPPPHEGDVLLLHFCRSPREFQDVLLNGNQHLNAFHQALENQEGAASLQKDGAMFFVFPEHYAMAKAAAVKFNEVKERERLENDSNKKPAKRNEAGELLFRSQVIVVRALKEVIKARVKSLPSRFRIVPKKTVFRLL